MKNNKGVTLIMVLMTVVVLSILAGVVITTTTNTIANMKIEKFKTNIKLIQKQVDIFMDEGKDYNTIGRALTADTTQILSSILEEDNNIETTSANDPGLRYFSYNDIKTVFDIDTDEEDYFINFSNREIISVSGIKKDEIFHHVEKGL